MNPKGEPMSNIKRYNILAIFVICMLGAIIYSNTFHSPFCFDDISSITKNFAIRNLYNSKNIWNFWPTRFITYLSIAINYHFGCLNVIGYHIFNLIIHLFSAILLFWFTLLTLSTPLMKDEKISSHSGLVAFFAGLIFVSHPIQTQGVTYIVQRAASITTLFYLGAITLYAKSRLVQYEKTGSKKWVFYYAASLILSIAAMFTKETAITLPLMILLYEIVFLKKERRINWRYLSPFLITILIIPMTMLITKSVNFEDMHRMAEGAPNVSHKNYILTQFRALVTYIRLLFLPIKQNLDYDYPISRSLTEPSTLSSLLFLTMILAIAVKLLRKYRLISFGIFWFFLTLLPESGLVPIKDVIFEHRLYLAMTGFSIFFVSLLYNIFARHSLTKLTILIIVIITSYSALTYRRNLVWKDEVSIWNDVIRKSPHKARPYYNRGVAYANKHYPDKAILDFNKALEINPYYVSAYYNRGNIYSDRGNNDLAIPDYDRAIMLNPADAKAYYNRGSVYFDKGRYDDAMLDFSKALSIEPTHAKAYNNRGIAYAIQGNYDQAIADLDKALDIDPRYAEAYNNRATAYCYKGNFDKSWKDIHKAMSLGFKVNPKFITQLKKASGRED